MSQERKPTTPGAQAHGPTESKLLSDDFFPIYNWAQRLHPEKGWAERTLQDLAELGLTAVMTGGEMKPTEVLDLCQKYGLKAIVSLPDIIGSRNLREADPTLEQPTQDDLRKRYAPVKELARHPALLGVMFGDEPHAANMAAMAKEYHVFKELLPSIVPYCDVYPNGLPPDRLGVETYEEYVRTYVETVNPVVVSGISSWAFQEDETNVSWTWMKPCDTSTRMDEWLEGIEILSRVAREHDILFWNFVSCVGFANQRVKSEADLTFQVYGALAHGARGIAYFMTGPGGGWARGYPLDGFGHRTPTFDIVRRLNLQIRTLAPLLLRLRLKDVYHWPDVPKGCKALTGKGVIKKPTVSADGRSIFIGEFVHEDGSPYVIVVNKNLERSCNLGDLLRGKYGEGDVFYQQNRWGLSKTGEDKLELRGSEAGWVAPGDAWLLRVPVE